MIYQEVEAHLHSQDGQMGRAVLLGPTYIYGQPQNNSYIFVVGKTLCTGLFNFYVGQYYVDDKYGIIDENNENYDIYKEYLEV